MRPRASPSSRRARVRRAISKRCSSGCSRATTATPTGTARRVTAFVSPSLVLAVDEGEVFLGTWQRVVVVDPNRENDRRRLRLSFVGG
jgi:hypothetical protein